MRHSAAEKASCVSSQARGAVHTARLFRERRDLCELGVTDRYDLWVFEFLPYFLPCAANYPNASVTAGRVLCLSITVALEQSSNHTEGGFSHTFTHELHRAAR